MIKLYKTKLSTKVFNANLEFCLFTGYSWAGDIVRILEWVDPHLENKNKNLISWGSLSLLFPSVFESGFVRRREIINVLLSLLKAH